MTTPPPDASGELRKLRYRVDALAGKRREADARLRGLLAALLPLDDLLADTARRAERLGTRRGESPTPDAVTTGVREQIDAAHQLLRAELRRHHVHPMELTGRTADPAEARVVAVEPHPTAPLDTVLRETVPGFRFGQDTLRQAEVVLAVTGPAPDPVDVPAPGGDVTVPGRNQPRRTTRARRRSRARTTARPLPRKRTGRRKR